MRFSCSKSLFGCGHLIRLGARSTLDFQQSLYEVCDNFVGQDGVQDVHMQFLRIRFYVCAGMDYLPSSPRAGGGSCLWVPLMIGSRTVVGLMDECFKGELDLFVPDNVLQHLWRILGAAIRNFKPILSHQLFTKSSVCSQGRHGPWTIARATGVTWDWGAKRSKL